MKFLYKNKKEIIITILLLFISIIIPNNIEINKNNTEYQFGYIIPYLTLYSSDNQAHSNILAAAKNSYGYYISITNMLANILYINIGIYLYNKIKKYLFNRKSTGV